MARGSIFEVLQLQVYNISGELMLCINFLLVFNGGKACVHTCTNGTNGITILFKVLPTVPLVIPLVSMVPLVKTVGSQKCRLYTV